MQDHPFQWTFSTLGCPDLNLDEICRLAKQWGIRVLELRCLEGRIDLPAYFEETYGQPERMAEVLASHGLGIQLFDTSFQLIHADPTAQQEELLRFVPWAEALGVPFLRVFDGSVHGQAFTPALARQAAASVRWWRERRAHAGWQVDILMETHTACVTSGACLDVQKALDEPLLLLWDSHHTWRAGEPLLGTWLALSPFVRHVHVKDSGSDSAAAHIIPAPCSARVNFPGRSSRALGGECLIAARSVWSGSENGVPNCRRWNKR